MTQPGLIQIASKINSLAPSNEEQIQMYFDRDSLNINGKGKTGLTRGLAIRLPDAVGTTIDENPVELILASIISPPPLKIKIPINTSQFFSYFVMATRTGGPAPGVIGASGIGQMQFLVRNLAGVTTIVIANSPQPTNTGDAEAAAWSTAVTLGGVDGDEIICLATGESGKIIKWNATIVRLADLFFG